MGRRLPAAAGNGSPAVSGPGPVRPGRGRHFRLLSLFGPPAAYDSSANPHGHGGPAVSPALMPGLPEHIAGLNIHFGQVRPAAHRPPPAGAQCEGSLRDGRVRPRPHDAALQPPALPRPPIHARDQGV